MIWYTYILECVDSSYYVGISNQLEQRIKRHNSGNGAKYTRSRQPVKLVWKERHGSMIESMRKEAQIKKWSHNRKKELINNCPSLLSGRKKKQNSIIR